jgi:sarcosine oxidase subunit beta
MRTIIVGGGLIGCATAFFLARRGVAVTLIERNRIGAAASGASFGNCRRTNRPVRELELSHRSRRLWGRLEELVGVDVEFRATGHLRLAFDADGLADMQAYAGEARHWGLDLEELDGRDIARRFPGIAPDAIGASYSPDDGSANPRLVPPAFAAAARRLGAEIVEQVGDVTLRRTEFGFNVDTRQGRFQADRAVNAAGAWGARIAQDFGEVVPLSSHGPQMGVTEPLPYRIRPVLGVWSRVAAHGIYLRQVERGNVVFGGAAARVKVALDPGHARYAPGSLTAQIPALLRVVPALADAAIIRTWSGCEGYMRDSKPVIGASATTPGLYHAFGFSGHGFQMGPGVGDALTELIVTGSCETPLEEFAITRFAA